MIVLGLELNWLDYLMLGIIGLSILLSLVRGFVREAISMATWVLAIWIVVHFSAHFSQYFVDHIASNSLRLLLSSGVLFLGTLVTGAVVGSIFGNMLSKAKLSGTDRCLGAAFGLARGVLVVSLLVMLVRATSLTETTLWTQSALLPQFDRVSVYMSQLLPNEFNELLHFSPIVT